MSKPLYVVIDFESTCWNEPNSPSVEETEVIELGAVVMAEDGANVAEFQSFSRPSIYPQLSKFCTELTTIVQDQVNLAPRFTTVYRNFTRWTCGVRDSFLQIPSGTSFKAFSKPLIFPEDLVMLSWGQYDLTQLGRECRRMYVPLPFTKHINLKKFYQFMFDEPRKRCGLGYALEKLGITFQGTPHRGIDDARMIAAVYKTMVNKHNFDLEV